MPGVVTAVGAALLEWEPGLLLGLLLPLLSLEPWVWLPCVERIVGVG